MRRCPKCKSTDYNNAQFQLMVNECGHSLCANCVQTLYARNAAPCYACGRVLKRNNFWPQTFDDPLVEKDAHWRHKLKKVYNLREDDFPTAAAYNDYLEEFERVVASLVAETDVDATHAAVKQFATEHQEAIARNRNRKSADDLWIEKMLQEDREYRRRVEQEREQSRLALTSRLAAREERQRSAQALVAQLADSDTPAAVIVDAAKRQRQTEAEAKKGEAVEKLEPRWRRGGGAGDPVGDSAAPSTPFVYTPYSLELAGPPPPADGDLWTDAYLTHVRAANEQQLAGGFHHVVACKRVLTEAMCGMDLSAVVTPTVS